MDNFCSLNGKTIIITGAASGIGRECAIKTANSGATIILVDQNEDGLNKTLSLIGVEKHLKIVCDLLNIEDFESKLETILNGNKASGFVHSAGIEMTKPLKILKKSDYEKVFSINVISGFEISKILSKKKYLSDDGASFIFISSIMSVVGQSGKIGYSASKGALVSGCKSMALELATKKIRVNSISPGMVKTKMSEDLLTSLSDSAKNDIEMMHPLGIGKPEYIANVALFLLSDETKWITGTNIIVDGGYSAK